MTVKVALSLHDQLIRIRVTVSSYLIMVSLKKNTEECDVDKRSTERGVAIKPLRRRQ